MATTKPRIGDRVESIRGVRTGTYNGGGWVAGMCGELTAFPSAVRPVGCRLCGKRHQTFALVEFWTYATDADGELESPLRKMHDRVALAICDIRRI